MEYAGKFVFVQLPGSGYYDGEHFVLKDGIGCFYGIRPIGGYEGSKLHRFDLLPESKSKCTVLESGTDWLRVQELAQSLEAFSKEPESGKKEWVDEVYHGAANNARMIRKLIEKNLRIMEPIPIEPPIYIDLTSGAFITQHREFCRKLKKLVDEYAM